MTDAESWVSTGVERRYPGSNGVLTAVRADIRAWLLTEGFSNEVIDRAVLIISELATNAIEADPGQPFDVGVARSSGSADLAPDGVVMIVTNSTSGTRPPPRSAWSNVDPLALRGRGLAIAARLCDEVNVEDIGPNQVRIVARLSERVDAGHHHSGPADTARRTIRDEEGTA